MLSGITGTETGPNLDSGTQERRCSGETDSSAGGRRTGRLQTSEEEEEEEEEVTLAPRKTECKGTETYTLEPHYAQSVPSSPGKIYMTFLETGMYHHPQNSVPRHPGLNLNAPSFVPTPPHYSEFHGYHHHPHVPGISNEPHPAQNGGRGRGRRLELALPAAGRVAAVLRAPRDCTECAADVQRPSAAALLPASMNPSGGQQLSPNALQRRNPYDWMRRSTAPPSTSSKRL
ncbi:hypothetical protein CRUP_032075 [Coryphaenoides rupestris]|nr:hypothetical protein CRUP_032075 [Coryphaenoides rupestris]